MTEPIEPTAVQDDLLAQMVFQAVCDIRTQWDKDVRVTIDCYEKAFIRVGHGRMTDSPN